MITNIPAFLSTDAVESVLEDLAWYKYQEIPVVDSAGELLGKLPLRNILRFKNNPDGNFSSEIASTGNAIGELYQIWLSGLLQGGKE